MTKSRRRAEKKTWKTETKGSPAFSFLSPSLQGNFPFAFMEVIIRPGGEIFVGVNKSDLIACFWLCIGVQRSVLKAVEWLNVEMQGKSWEASRCARHSQSRWFLWGEVEGRLGAPSSQHHTSTGRCAFHLLVMELEVDAERRSCSHACTQTHTHTHAHTLSTLCLPVLAGLWRGYYVDKETD